MQSVCVLLENEYAGRVVDARALLCSDPEIGAIYDPPFAHFTIQLAEEYDWAGLQQALSRFASQWEPFELVTSGLFVSTGKEIGIAIAPRKDRHLLEFHAAVWETITPFAQGRVVPFYHPDNWVPHVTIKRAGSDASRFGAAMAKLGSTDFQWTSSVTNVSVQHDPGKNSLTHYVRLRFPLSGSAHTTSQSFRSNATLLSILSPETSNSSEWRAHVRGDDGREIDVRWDAPMLARTMASVQSSSVHFTNARCWIDEEVVSAIQPKTPFPVA